VQVDDLLLLTEQPGRPSGQGREHGIVDQRRIAVEPQAPGHNWPRPVHERIFWKTKMSLN
jgi:hypothetical protein